MWEAIETDPQTLLWPGVRSAAVTEVLHFPRKSVMNLWLIGGDLEELLYDMLPHAEQQARAWELDQMWGMGRPGWARALRTLGYDTNTVIVKKNLA